MKKRIIIQFSLIAFCSVLFHSCDNSTEYQPKGNYISGHTIFMDTNFVLHNGHYEIALFRNLQNPFNYEPVSSAEVSPVKNLAFYYRIYWSGHDDLYLAMIWRSDSVENYCQKILGTFGCDTAHNCIDHKLIAFPNFTGADYDFMCWADTSKKLN